MNRTPIIDKLTRLLAIAALTAIAGCRTPATETPDEPAPVENPTVRIAPDVRGREVQPTPRSPKGRYLTTVGLPGVGMGETSAATQRLERSLRPIESIPVRAQQSPK